jgi:hypothetical protein
LIIKFFFIIFGFNSIKMERAKIIKTGNVNLEQINNGLSDQTIKFIEWIFIDGEWIFDPVEGVWKKYGYRSRTTQELFNYYLTSNIK